MWCIAELTPAYLAQMEDLLALYERPDNPKEPVVGLEEKPVALHAEVRPPRPARPGHLATRDNEYERRGVANVFGVVEPQAGRHFTCATANRSAPQLARMVRTIVDAYPAARTIHLVMDNVNTHTEKALTDHFGPRWGHRLWRRLTVHWRIADLLALLAQHWFDRVPDEITEPAAQAWVKNAGKRCDRFPAFHETANLNQFFRLALSPAPASATLSST